MKTILKELEAKENKLAGTKEGVTV